MSCFFKVESSDNELARRFYSRFHNNNFLLCIYQERKKGLKILAFKFTALIVNFTFFLNQQPVQKIASLKQDFEIFVFDGVEKRGLDARGANLELVELNYLQDAGLIFFFSRVSIDVFGGKAR